MFRNYYKMLNISSNADDKEIYSAYEKSELNPIMLDEIRMVLMNKSLKAIYDAEIVSYELSESKQNYEITNPTLDREIKKIKVYVYVKSQMLPYESKEDKTTRIIKWLWNFILSMLALGILMGVDSYYKGAEMEKRKQVWGKEWLNSYNNKPASSSTANNAIIFRQTNTRS